MTESLRKQPNNKKKQKLNQININIKGYMQYSNLIK